jgi:Bpu10I restriction endonuclease
MQVTKSATHGDKLTALLSNSKLPNSDKARVATTVEQYKKWIKTLETAQGEGGVLLSTLVRSLNEYKRHVEVDLIFDADDDFLYRQKGQLKLDNTILEEFLPYLFDVRLIPGLGRVSNLKCGPQSSFAGLSFGSPLVALNDGGVFLKLKDQDFAVSKSHTVVITDDHRKDERFSSSFVVSHRAGPENLDRGISGVSA